MTKVKSPSKNKNSSILNLYKFFNRKKNANSCTVFASWQHGMEWNDERHEREHKQGESKFKRWRRRRVDLFNGQRKKYIFRNIHWEKMLKYYVLIEFYNNLQRTKWKYIQITTSIL